MDIKEAIGIILDLADQNILSEEDAESSPELEQQRKYQIEAHDIVAAFFEGPND